MSLQRHDLTAGGRAVELLTRRTEGGLALEGPDGPLAVEVLGRSEHGFVLRVGDRIVRGHVTVTREAVVVEHEGRSYRLERSDATRVAAERPEAHAGRVHAPMTGKVIEVACAVGDRVGPGDTLVVVEAMKMEHRLAAEAAGAVTAVHVEDGRLVDIGQLLVELEPEGSRDVSTPVAIVEVGPRDGLQNEPELVPTEVKVRFVEALAAAGHRRIEATAFVSPKWVPQLSDAEDVLAGLDRREGVRYSALVPNARGLERALAAGADEVAVFTAASDSFNRRNVNTDTEGTLERFRQVLEEAGSRGLPVRGYVSTVLHCPYEGRIDPGVAVRLVRRLLAAGCYEVSLGDTIGKATPNEVRDLCRRLAADGLLGRCAGHFHDTYGMACANTLAALEEGVRVFDASSGGLGGCPYAPGASGNAATEDLVHLLHGRGCPTGIDPEAQCAATRIVEEHLQRRLPGRAYGAWRSRQDRE